MIDSKVRIQWEPNRLMRGLAQGQTHALRRIGAFVMRGAQQSMRKGGTSQPGQPPKVQTELLKRLLVFHHDPTTNSVIIGPTMRHRPPNEDGRPVSGTIPEVLEKGGAITVREYQSKRSGKWHRAISETRIPKGARTRAKIVQIQARPYMVPALERESANKKLEQAWRDIIR